jgi:hypothetical protein
VAELHGRILAAGTAAQLVVDAPPPQDMIPYKESWQDMRQPTRAVNGLLQWIFSSERKMLGKLSLPFGLSLLAVLSLPTNE